MRLVDRSLYTGVDASAQFAGRSSAATNQPFVNAAEGERFRRIRSTPPTYDSQTQQFVKNVKVRRRNDLKKPLVRVRSSRRRTLSKREPKPKQSKVEKEIGKAKKLLADDLKAEMKDQDKATHKALGGVNKAQNRANRATQDELNRARKFQGEDMQRIRKTQEEVAKYASHRGMKDKDGRKYEKALKNELQAEQDLVQLKEKGRKSMAGIAQDEERMIEQSGQKLTKSMTKAHTDQFGDKGARLAKSHPSAWQKFKKVMAKIGDGLEWALSGLSLLVPGFEGAGLARLAAKGAEMIAKKVASKSISQAAKKGMKDEWQMKDGRMVNVVYAAKTESDTDIARAKANEKLGLDKWGNAVRWAARPANNPKAAYHNLYGRERLYRRFGAQRFDHGPWALGA